MQLTTNPKKQTKKKKKKKKKKKNLLCVLRTVQGFVKEWNEEFAQRNRLVNELATTVSGQSIVLHFIFFCFFFVNCSGFFLCFAI